MTLENPKSEFSVLVESSEKWANTLKPPLLHLVLLGASYTRLIRGCSEMTATRNVDSIRWDRAMLGLPSSAFTQLFINLIHFTLCSVKELAVETRVIPALFVDLHSNKVIRKTAA